MSLPDTRKPAAALSGPVGLTAGFAISLLLRKHLNAEYIFIVGILCAAVVGLTLFAVWQTSKDTQREQLEFEQKLRNRRRSKAPTVDTSC